jgi:hypothetical protein
MELGSRTKMVNFEPVDEAPAPVEPDAATEQHRDLIDEILGGDAHSVGEMQLIGLDWV